MFAAAVEGTDVCHATGDAVTGFTSEERASLRSPTSDQAIELSTELIGRARAEFREMPGMQLTSRQAARLWGLDLVTAECVLRALVAARFLTERGQRYSQASHV
jgi:hypothetical protein